MTGKPTDKPAASGSDRKARASANPLDTANWNARLAAARERRAKVLAERGVTEMSGLKSLRESGVDAEGDTLGAHNARRKSQPLSRAPTPVEVQAEASRTRFVTRQEAKQKLEIPKSPPVEKVEDPEPVSKAPPLKRPAKRIVVPDEEKVQPEPLAATLQHRDSEPEPVVRASRSPRAIMFLGGGILLIALSLGIYFNSGGETRTDVPDTNEIASGSSATTDTTASGEDQVAAIVPSQGLNSDPVIADVGTSTDGPPTETEIVTDLGDIQPDAVAPTQADTLEAGVDLGGAEFFEVAALTSVAPEIQLTKLPDLHPNPDVSMEVPRINAVLSVPTPPNLPVYGSVRVASVVSFLSVIPVTPTRFDGRVHRDSGDIIGSERVAAVLTTAPNNTARLPELSDVSRSASALVSGIALSDAPEAEGNFSGASSTFAEGETAIASLGGLPVVPLYTTPTEIDGPPAAIRSETIEALRDIDGVLHIPASVSASQVQKIQSDLAGTGYDVRTAQRTNLTIGNSNVRYFHRADADAARTLAESVGARLRDFTDFRPSPPVGLVEIWISGRGGGTSAATPARTARATNQPRAAAPVVQDPEAVRQELLNVRSRLIDGLRSGDYLE